MATDNARLRSLNPHRVTDSAPEAVWLKVGFTPDRRRRSGSRRVGLPWLPVSPANFIIPVPEHARSGCSRIAIELVVLLATRPAIAYITHNPPKA